jgi:predicted GNAT superfamily acetyltransferase
MIVYRHCEGFEELEACVRLQVETWGYDASDVIPRKVYRVAQKIGGQVLGAFDTDIDSGERGNAEAMVGFLLALPGVKTTGEGRATAYLHSHMLAVRETCRNRGLGRELKLLQRVDALQRGIRLIEWTFDPLEIKNAYLNIRKLGAVVSTYLVDFYGVSSSQLQGGLPTDRLVAAWHLDSARVRDILERKPAIAAQIEERIVVPASIYRWKANPADRERAEVIQQENRRRFQQAFAQGLAVLGFDLDREGNGIYGLGRLARPEAVLKGPDRYES